MLPVGTLAEAMRERLWQITLKEHRGGIMGTYRDGSNMPITVHQWHPDNAPTLDDVLKRN